MKDSAYSTYRDGEYIEVPPIDKLCLALKEKFLRQEEENERLKAKNKELLDEHYKDNELAALKEENKRLEKLIIRGFSISEEDDAKIKEWLDNHECRFKSMRNSKIGGPGPTEYRFSIIPGIGYNSYVRCKCGKEFCFHEE